MLNSVFLTVTFALLIFCADGLHNHGKRNKHQTRQSDSNETCQENEVYNSCGNGGCEATCEEPTKGCTEACYPTGLCQCSAGYIRDTSTGKCVLQEQCPNLTCTKKNEYYNSCGNGRCEATCDEPTKACTKACYPTGLCQCSAGYVRDTNTGECVLQEQCPNSNCTKKNEYYTTCGNGGCEATCQNPSPNCSWDCKDSGFCVCSYGYIRDKRTRDCILPETCPNRLCPTNETWHSCQPCTESCSMVYCLWCPPIPGCYCKGGYYRNRGGKCVKCSNNSELFG